MLHFLNRSVFLARRTSGCLFIDQNCAKKKKKKHKKKRKNMIENRLLRCGMILLQRIIFLCTPKCTVLRICKICPIKKKTIIKTIEFHITNIATAENSSITYLFEDRKQMKMKRRLISNVSYFRKMLFIRSDYRYYYNCR